MKDNGAVKIEVSVYIGLIGSLLYLTANETKYLMYATSFLSRFMSSPCENHFAATKIILKYVKGTVDCRIWYLQLKECKLLGYMDGDLAGRR